LLFLRRYFGAGTPFVKHSKNMTIMKIFHSLTVLFCFALLSSAAVAQKPACCSSNATAHFASLGANESFQMAHLPPEPVSFQAKKGMMISFDTPDGVQGKAFMVPAYKKTDNYLFVFHEWWGLNDYIKHEAEKFAEELGDVNVMAIDLYDGQIATNAEDAGRIMQSVKQERAESIIKGALGYIRTNARVQSIGWCFGGGWSLQASMIAGSKSAGCVMYYGMPEKDEAKLKKFNAPVLGIFASRDGWVNREVVDAFEKQMKVLKKDIDVHWYDAEHAFANPSNPKYDVESTLDARKKSLEFIRKNFSLN
jgi:carboxymethylenebutenolidase